MTGKAQPTPSADQAKDRRVRSGEIAETYDRTFAECGLFKFDHQLLGRWFERPGRLLDLGCGTGRTVIEFARRGFDSTGVDLSPDMLAIARQKAEAAGLANVRLLEGDVADLPLDQLRPPYDYAVCLGAVLGYVRGRAGRLRALRQAASLLAPGGQYVFHVQNLAHNVHTFSLPWIVTGAARAAVGRGEFGDQVLWWYRGLRWVTMHAFRLGEIRSLVRDAGLDLAEIVRLNRAASGPLEGTSCRNWRANGFIVRCVRPGGTH
jgi:SAM-dependent methyltransferase